MTVNIGDIERVSTNPPFSNSAGTPTDPTAVSLSWQIGNAAPTVWVYGTDIQVVRDSAGTYRADIPIAAAGHYFFTWIGTGTVTAVAQGDFIVSGFAPEVTTTPYCTVDDVLQRLAGDNPSISEDYRGVVSAKCNEVTDDINRMISKARRSAMPWSFVADSVASTRIYAGRPGPIRLLPIDDAFSVSSVTLYSSGVLQRTLAAGTDYVPWPYSGGPIVGLMSLRGCWQTEPGSIQVSARWGYGLAVPVDAREAAIIEVIRSRYGDREGNDDRLGMTPFGSVTIAKAFTSKLKQLVSDYGFAGGFLR